MSKVVQARGQEFVNGSPVVFIISGADKSSRLMQNDGLDFEGFDSPSLSPNEVSWLDSVTRVHTDLAVDDDFTLLNDGITGAARAYPSRREILVEADSFRWVH